MTAHDDDQELVTIRIPRRAAALYAAELDVASSPAAVRFGLVFGFALCFVFACIGLAFVWDAFFGEAGDPSIWAKAIEGGFGLIFLLVATTAGTFQVRRVNAMRRRRLF